MSLPARALRRQLAADRWVALLLAVLTAAGGLLAAGAPSLVDDVRDRGLRTALTDAPASFRDVIAASPQQVVAGPDGDRARPYDELVAGVVAAAGGPLDAVGEAAGGPVTGTPWWQFQTPVLEDVGAPGPRLRRWVSLRVAGEWPQRVRLVEGRLPGPAAPADPPGAESAADPGRRAAVVEVVLSAATAEALQLQVGDTWQADVVRATSAVPRLGFRLVGTFAARDEADLFWDGDTLALRPKVFYSDALGTVWSGIAFTGPDSLAVLADELANLRPTTTVRLPVDPVAAARVDPQQLVTAVRRATTRSAAGAGDGGTASVFLPTSRLDEVVVDHLRARRPVDALSGLLLVTLLAATAIVLLLAARLLLDRRREAVALTRARGASAAQVLGVLAAEALVLGLPAALAGGAVALALPGAPGLTGALLLVAVAVAPAVATVVAAAPLVRDVGLAPAGGTRRARLLAQAPRVGLALLVGLAAVAVVALRRRGLDVAATSSGASDARSAAGLTGLPESGLDPLVVAAPVLVAVVVAVLAARLVALPVGLAARLAARGRGAVGFLGLARARRTGGGALPGVSLVLCLAVCVLSVVTGRTVEVATARAAVEDVAAPLRVHSLGFPADAAPALQRLPGVTAVARLTEVGNAAYTPQRDDGSAPVEELVPLFGTDPEALARVQAGLPDDAPGVRVLTAAEGATLAAPGPDGRLPFAVGAATARVAPLGTPLTVRLGARRLDGYVAVVAPRLAGMPASGQWLLGSLDGLRERTALVLSPQDLLAAASPVPTPDTVTAVVPESTTVRTPQEARDASTRAPLAEAVRSALPRTLVVGALLAVAAVVLALLLGARSRARFVAHLRALGLSARQTSALVVLEVAPVALAALAGGLVAGVLLGGLVLPVADLRPLTGATGQPPPVLPGVPLLALAAGFVLVVAVGVLGAVLAGRSVSPAQAARTVEGS